MKLFSIDFPGYITGLLNKTFDKTNYVSGRAATEDQLAALAGSIETDTNTVTTVSGSGGISVTDTSTDGNHAYNLTLASGVPTAITAGDDIAVSETSGNYTIDLVDDYMVYSLSQNIIITAEGDGSDNEIFYYDTSKTGLDATNNRIGNFVTTKQKIQLAGTGLTAGVLPAFGDATTGVYWNATDKNLLVNGNAVVNILNGTPVAADIEIVS